MAPTVLIVSEPDDAHALAVAERLEQEHDLSSYILRMRDFPELAQASFQNYGDNCCRYTSNTGGIEFKNVRSIWWRRPASCEPPRIFTGLDHGEFVQAECDHFLQGLLWSHRCLWINDPMRNLLASRKIVQLSHAREAGLRTPRTLVTNNSTDVHTFVKEAQGRIVFKRIGTSAGPASKTSFLTLENLEALDVIMTCPTMFQDYIEAQGDVRVIWIDGMSWAIFIDSQSGISPEDSRFDLTVAHRPCNLPPEIQQALTRLMLNLGLVYGAIDLRIGLDDQWYFLEVNPSGQFLYLEMKTGLPLVSALANVLARGSTSTMVFSSSTEEG